MFGGNQKYHQGSGQHHTTNSRFEAASVNQGTGSHFTGRDKTKQYQVKAIQNCQRCGKTHNINDKDYRSA